MESNACFTWKEFGIVVTRISKLCNGMRWPFYVVALALVENHDK